MRQPRTGSGEDLGFGVWVEGFGALPLVARSPRRAPEWLLLECNVPHGGLRRFHTPQFWGVM